MKTPAVLLTLGLALALAGCSKPKTAPPPPPVTIDVAAVNALVPAPLKDKLVFVQRDVEETRMGGKQIYALAAPKSWTPRKGEMFASLSPPFEDGFGNMTDLDLGTNCAGRCTAKDWAKVSEESFSQYRKMKVIKDEPSATSHLMVAESDDTTYILYAWWYADAPSYNTCRVALSSMRFGGEGPDVRTAVPAFEKACRAVNTRAT